MFSCEKCGACCRNLNLIFGGVSPLPTKDGRECVYLDGNTCTVYDERPLVCRVEELAEAANIEPEKMYAMTKQCCLVLQGIKKN